jgi:hypothetical protein
MVTAGQDRKLNIWNIVNGKHARSYKPDTSGGDELYKVCTPILYDTVVVLYAPLVILQVIRSYNVKRLSHRTCTNALGVHLVGMFEHIP